MAIDNNKAKNTSADKAEIAKYHDIIHFASHGSKLAIDSGTTIAPVTVRVWDFMAEKIGEHDWDDGKARLGFEVKEFLEKKNKLEDHRIILVGNHRAGKTTLLQSLRAAEAQKNHDQSLFFFSGHENSPFLAEQEIPAEYSDTVLDLYTKYLEEEPSFSDKQFYLSEYLREEYSPNPQYHSSSTDIIEKLENLWERIREDEDLMAYIAKQIRKRYRDIRRAYFKRFHQEIFYQDDRTDFADRYRYLDLRTTHEEVLKLDTTLTNFKNQAVKSLKIHSNHGIIRKIKKKTRAA